MTFEYVLASSGTDDTATAAPASARSAFVMENLLPLKHFGNGLPREVVA
jgi:hypothetical protein